jgi:hypothetical protein
LAGHFLGFCVALLATMRENGGVESKKQKKTGPHFLGRKEPVLAS